MKKISVLLLAGILTIGALTGCGGASQSAGSEENNVLKVAASATPHAEILEQAKPLLEAEGIELEITVFDDYVQPNEVVESGEFDANYFQHQPYLDDYVAQTGGNVVSVGIIHTEPMGLYGGRQADLGALGK